MKDAPTLLRGCNFSKDALPGNEVEGIKKRNQPAKSHTSNKKSPNPAVLGAPNLTAILRKQQNTDSRSTTKREELMHLLILPSVYLYFHCVTGDAQPSKRSDYRSPCKHAIPSPARWA